MKVLVTGSEGFIGRNIILSLINDTSIDLLGVDLSGGQSTKLDVSDQNKFYKYLKTHRPDKIIHAAAIKQLETCESHKYEAFKVNTLSTETIVKYCLNENNHCDVCYISSDVIFDGKTGNYKIESEINPINWYGKTKAFSEILLRNITNVAIYRTSLVVGSLNKSYKKLLEEELNNGVLQNQTLLPQYIYEKLKNDEKIYLPNDVRSNPTPIQLLQQTVSKFINDPLFGIFHVAGASQLSRFEFGLNLAKLFGFDSDLIKNDPHAVSKIRPLDITLDVGDSYSRLSLEVEDWTFRKYINNLGLR